VWQRRSDGQPPLVIGHRGASAVALENTIASFERARADGADAVELDVSLCATGEIMVFHDDDLLRLGGRPDRIADLPFAALRELRLTGGGAIPTLDEAFEACGPSMGVNVELKAAGLAAAGVRRLVAAVAGSIEQAGLASRVLVSSFNPWAVRAWQRSVPSVRAAWLFERSSPLPARRGWLAAWLRPYALHPERALCHPSRVAAWRRRGYFVSTWTVDDPIELRACRDMRVDAVISNDPARARAALTAS
jgi:glycerophosphoryl diester phosphodiesterase